MPLMMGKVQVLHFIRFRRWRMSALTSDKSVHATNGFTVTRPIAGTELCQAAHTGYQISGRLRIQLADGTTFDAEPGQVGNVPPGHDAWVIGNETVVLLDWAGATGYAQ